MKPCNCGTKTTFLHLSTCNSLEIKEKLPLDFLHKEATENPGSIIFYITNTDEDSEKQLKTFRSALLDEDWMYQVAAGVVGTITLNNTTEVTFLPESEAQLLLELPNSGAIFFEMTDKNKELAENLFPKTGKMFFVDPISKELV